ncbi:hypothetical protein QQ045_020273 [Rhodiola kirilowii]
MHLFKECWWMMSLLDECQLPDTVWNNQCREPGYWLWLCAKVCSDSEFTSLLCGLWLGWKNRNDLVHGKEERNLMELKARLQFLLMEVKNGCRRNVLRFSDLEEAKADAIVMCDGSFDSGSRRGGWGVVLLQDEKVEVVKAGWSEGLTSCFETECKALKLGLELADSLQIQKAILVSDSAEVVWAINAGTWRAGTSLSGIRDCIKLMDSHPGWSIVSTARELNRAADWVARKARMEKWGWSCSNAIPMFCPTLLCRC